MEIKTEPAKECQELGDSSAIGHGATRLLDVHALVHELQVHRTEVEAQNEELINSGKAFETLSKQYQDLYDFAPVSYLTLGLDGTIRNLNLTCASFLGRSREQLVGQNFTSFLAKLSIDTFIEALFEAVASRSKVSCELLLCRGTDRLQVLFNAATNDLGDGCLVVLVDITARKLEEESVRRSWHFLQSMIDALPSSVCVLDEKGTLLLVNQGWNRISEANPPLRENCGVGANYLEICEAVTGEDREASIRFAQGIRSVLQEKSASYTQEYSCHSDHELRWFKGSVTRFVEEGAARIVVTHENITERILASEALKSSQHRLQFILESSQVGVWELNVADQTASCSKESAKILGFSGPLSDWSLKVFLQHVVPDDREQVVAKVREGVRTGNDMAYDCRIRRGDGEVRWIRVAGRRHQDESGWGPWIAGIVQDVTEQKRLTEELQESRRKEQERRTELESLMEAVPAAVFIAHDRECRNVSGNATAIDLLKVPAKVNLSTSAPEAQRKTNFEPYRDGCLVPPEALPVQRAAATGSPVLGEELELRFGDGSSRWIFGSAVPLRQESGEVRGAIGAFVDVSERKRFEEDLRKSEERQRLFIEHAPAALAMFDRNMQYLSVSRRWKKDYRLDDIDLFGVCHYQVFPEITEEWKELHRRGLEGERLRSDADRFVRFDGVVQWVRWEMLPWYTRSGEVGGIVIFSEDITEVKLAEERLAQSEENYRQLCHYQEDLIDRERTSISRSIHDDIGQGLTGVYLDLDWIRHKLSPQHGDSNLEELLTTMQARVNQLIVKVQNITADLRPPLLDNLGLKAAVEWQIQEFTRQSMIKTGLVIDDDLPVTDGENSNAIIRILKEALINVLRHSQAEAVDISLCRFGQHLVLEITDDGCGITQEQLSSRTAFGIMGMRERAEACRGELEIWGAPGVGTTVLLEVPVITEGGHV